MTGANSVEVGGTTVSFTVEGTGEANLLLVHGFAAHSHWWDWVVPSLTSVFRIARIDLSGHGESGYRDEYSVDTWAAEVAGVQRAAFGNEPAVLVAHSLGGRIVIAAAHREDSNASSVLIFDTAFPTSESRVSHGAPKPVRRIYESREAAIDRFRLLPAQPVDDVVLRTLAGHSVREEADGWTWKHDHRLSPTALALPSLSELTVPFDIVYGEHSQIVNSEMAHRTARLAASAVSITEIAGAHHHVVLEAPETVAEIIVSKASSRMA